MSGELMLTVAPHRKVYPAMDVAQQAYILLEITPTGNAPAAQNQPVNVCLVLDRSGSMSGAKLNAMKQAARLMVDQLGAQDLLSVVIFDDAQPAELVVPCAPVIDREAIQRKLNAIEERGGTHMSTGMRLGLQEMLRGRSPERVSSMILLTDGQTWEDQQECRDLADQCRMAGISIQAFGLGVGSESNWDPRLLEELAQRSGGEWMPVEAPDQVSAAFQKTLCAIQGAAVANANLTMRMVPGVTPRAVWRTSPLISRLDHHAVGTNDVQVFLGEIQQGAGQALLADLLLPPRAAGTFRLIQADVTYDVPGSGLKDQRVAIDVTLDFASDASQTSQVDERIMNLIERVVAHRLQTQALDDVAAGDASRATQRLRAAATRLLELGEVELARQADQQANLIEQGGHLDPAAAQKMRYATKRLTEIE